MPPGLHVSFQEDENRVLLGRRHRLLGGLEIQLCVVSSPNSCGSQQCQPDQGFFWMNRSRVTRGRSMHVPGRTWVCHDSVRQRQSGWVHQELR